MHTNNSPVPEQSLQNRRKQKWWQLGRLFQLGSIFQWTIIIFFAVTLPLILTLVYSVNNIQNYTEQSHTKLFQTVRVSESSEALLKYLLDMDRSIRQYKILEDAEIFTIFQNSHQKFVDIAARISQLRLPPEIKTLLSRLTQDELKLYDQILLIKGTGTLSTEDIKEYVRLREDGRQLITQVNEQIYIVSESLSALAILVRNQVTYSALTSIILAFLLGLLLSYLINKPIKNITQTIHKLGYTQFNQRIRIEGPSDLRELGRHLEWLRLRLNQLESSKQFFIKNISHELKTPLAIFIEGADLLQDEVVGELNAEQHKIIKLLKIANIRLRSLIENLIEYQQMTSTLAAMNYSQFNLNQLIKSVCVEYQLLLDSKNVSIEFEKKSVDLVADRDKIRIVMSNLLSNALRFSPQAGRILIKLSVINNSLQLLIADQGPGISKSHQVDIFNEFYKQPVPENWKIKGSGLGLSLVRTYVEAHKGRVSLMESDEKYCGAHFLVTLPLEPKEFMQNNISI